MAYVAPTVRSVGDAVTSADYNIVVNDVIDHETRILNSETLTTYTPTASGFTLGNGTFAAKYVKIGKLVTVVGTLTFGSTTSITGTLRISTPFVCNVRNSIGSAAFVDSGVAFYNGSVTVENSIDANLFSFYKSTTGASTSISSASPFTWGTGDQILWQITYETS